MLSSETRRFARRVSGHPRSSRGLSQISRTSSLPKVGALRQDPRLRSHSGLMKVPRLGFFDRTDTHHSYLNNIGVLEVGISTALVGSKIKLWGKDSRSSERMARQALRDPTVGFAFAIWTETESARRSSVMGISERCSPGLLRRK